MDNCDLARPTNNALGNQGILPLNPLAKSCSAGAERAIGIIGLPFPSLVDRQPRLPGCLHITCSTAEGRDQSEAQAQLSRPGGHKDHQVQPAHSYSGLDQGPVMRPTDQLTRGSWQEHCNLMATLATFRVNFG